MAQFPSTTSAYGRWGLLDIRDAIMGGNWPSPPVGDPYFNYVSMLLHGDGTNGAQNNTFLDASTNNFTITRNGNTTQGSFSPYGDNWSNYFDGSGDYLSVADNAALELGSGDFTIESWIYVTAYSPSYGGTYAATICAKEGVSVDESYRFVLKGTASSYTQIEVQLFATGSSTNTTVNYTTELNTWYHVAAVRNGTSVRIYVNGVDVGGNTNATAIRDTAAPFKIGTIGWPGYQYYFFGYISNLRLVKGTAVYTANFTPSTAPLTAIAGTSLLTCQSNRFKDASANNFTITANGDTSVQRFNPFGASTAYSAATIGGSGYFDGSGDYLYAGSNAAFQMGTGDFTYECFVYHSSISGQQTYFSDAFGDQAGMYFYKNTSHYPGVYYSSQIATSSVALVAGQWYHLAVTRSSGTLRIFVNGAQTASVSDSTNLTQQTQYIGGDNGASGFLNGYMSSARIVKGTAVYTAAFTPPTAPLTAVTNTQLLLNYTNAGIYDNAMMNDLETVGNAQISTSVKKFGTGSMYFDGSGDWLTIPYNQGQNFGTGNFTIEGWFYLNSLANSYYVLGGTWTSGTSDEWLIQIQNNGNIRFLTSLGTSFYSAGIATSTWYHFAAVRNGSTVTLYINGTSVGSYTNSNSIGSTSKTLYLGVQDNGAAWPWNGYIDDLRITKGYAQYTANFTPPTAAFPSYWELFQPGAPTGVSATAGDTQATVSFTAPTNYGGAPITSYTVTSSPGNFTATGASSPLTVTGLTNGTSYTFTVTATNSVGTGQASAASNSVTPSVPVAPSTVEYLVVAGGGGGGSERGGGGGAGGYLYNASYSVSTGSAITITVGAGGSGGKTGNAGGSNSQISGLSTVTAIGGGKGGGRNNPDGGPGTGGSGGGGTASNGGTNGGAGTAGQGNNGGIGILSSPYAAGGGGGAGGAGQDRQQDNGGEGGVGSSAQSSFLSLASAGQNVSGTYYIAGGGGGSTYLAGTIAPAGGYGGGGAGGREASPAVNSVSGTASTGGGGGGGRDNEPGGASGNGGSGIVIIRYADTYSAATSTTGSPTITVTGGYRIYKWTGSGSITF